MMNPARGEELPMTELLPMVQPQLSISITYCVP